MHHQYTPEKGSDKWLTFTVIILPAFFSYSTLFYVLKYLLLFVEYIHNKLKYKFADTKY